MPVMVGVLKNVCKDNCLEGITWRLTQQAVPVTRKNKNPGRFETDSLSASGFFRGQYCARLSCDRRLSFLISIGSDAVPSISFREVEESIHPMEESVHWCLDITIGDGEQSDTDGKTQLLKMLVLETETFVILDSFPQLLELFERGVHVGSWEYDHELITAVSSEYVGATERVFQKLCDNFQSLITGRVAEGVIQAFEMINVYHREAELCQC